MQIQFLPQFVAEQIPPSKNVALISITTPGHIAHLPIGWQNLLRLQFDDVEYEIPIFNAAKGRTDYATIFNEAHALQIIYFLSSLPVDVNRLIIHCSAGISRSAAVSNFAHEFFKIQIAGGDYSNANKLVMTTLYSTWHKVITQVKL